MTTRYEATVALNAGKCVFQDGDIGIFIDDVQVTDFTEIDKKVIELQAEFDNDYSRKRQAEYPAIAEQLDEIYHNGIDSWKAVIKVTKDKYPK